MSNLSSILRNELMSQLKKKQHNATRLFNLFSIIFH